MTNKYIGQEKRKHDRYEYTASVSIAKGASSEEGTVRNISMGGLLLETELKLDFGDEVVLHMTLPKVDKPCDISCLVRWVADSGAVGLHFKQLKAIETWAISQLVRTLGSQQSPI